MKIKEEKTKVEVKKRSYDIPKIIDKKELRVDLLTNDLPDEPPPPMGP